jgi:hypothetical protein
VLSTDLDGQGNLHVLNRHLVNDTDLLATYWHYKRIGTEWTRTPLPAGFLGDAIFLDKTTDTVYILGKVANKINLISAEKGTDSWATWSTVYTGAREYLEIAGNISAEGDRLTVVGQRVLPTATATSAPIDLLMLMLDAPHASSSSSVKSSSSKSSSSKSSSSSSSSKSSSSVKTSSSSVSSSSSKSSSSSSVMISSSSKSSSSKSSSSSSSSIAAPCASYIAIPWNTHTEVVLSGNSCLRFDRSLSGKNLQIWDSETVGACDYRGTLTSVNGTGALVIDSNYEVTAALTGSDFKLVNATGNTCTQLRVRTY